MMLGDLYKILFVILENLSVLKKVYVDKNFLMDRFFPMDKFSYLWIKGSCLAEREYRRETCFELFILMSMLAGSKDLPGHIID